MQGILQNFNHRDGTHFSILSYTYNVREQEGKKEENE